MVALSVILHTEIPYPAQVFNAWACRSVKPLVGGPQLAIETLSQRQVVGVVDCALLELASQLERPAMKIGRLMQFETRRQQTTDEIGSRLDT